MSTLTLTSPGVQINEVDLSLLTNTNGATNVLAVGFAPQGPTQEVVNVSSISEFESIYGVPTNAAERYLYHSASQLLNNSPANLLVSRLPYGANTGNGYSNSYSALVYPVSTNVPLFSQSTNYTLLEPTSILLTDTQFTQLEQNNFTWSSSPYSLSSVNYTYNTGTSAAALSTFCTTFFVNSGTDISTVSLSTNGTATSALNISYYPLTNAYSISGTGSLSSTVVGYGGNYILPTITGFGSLSANFSSGLVVINKSKTSIDNLFQGYYVGIVDNSSYNPSTSFNSITAIKTIGAIDQNGTMQDYLNVPQNRLNFPMTSYANSFSGSNSVSQVLENFPIGYNFSSASYNDSLTVNLIKLNTSTYNQDTVTLSYKIAESYAGSLNANRKQSNPSGGASLTFALHNVVNNASSNIQVLINPSIATQGNWNSTSYDSAGNLIPTKTVRVGNAAKNLYASGVYQSNTDYTSRDVGNIPLKLQNVINSIQNNDTIKLDLTIEAGLGTIWASANAYAADPNNAGKPVVYEESYNYSSSLGTDAQNDPSGIGTNLYRTDGSGSAWGTGAGADYLSVANQFVSLANNSRKDHVFIADPIRHLLIKGPDSKVTSQTGFAFSNDIYWPLYNQFASINSSYVAAYANWIKLNDVTSNKLVWVPSSGFVASSIASVSQQSFPWSAVAGFTRGTLKGVTDLAINPTQKQRDLLYKVNLNPIAYFPNEGYVIYGQKTLYRTPSAFDRLNVRELFLTLEKTTQSLLKYFVFEPNTYTTQTRLVATLKPVFDNAKINGGLYDYLIVCDSRNNTPAVIDNNQLAVSIYIQPVKTAEFILCDFIATQTGVDFNELVSNNQF